MQLEKIYHEYLAIENVEHTDVVFNQFLQECGKKICSRHGAINYVDGKVQCGVHTRKNDRLRDEGGEDAPFVIIIEWWGWGEHARWINHNIVENSLKNIKIILSHHPLHYAEWIINTI